MAVTGEQITVLFLNSFGQVPTAAGWQLDTSGNVPVLRRGSRVLALGVDGQGRDERITGWQLDGEHFADFLIYSRNPAHEQRRADALAALNEASR